MYWACRVRIRIAIPCKASIGVFLGWLDTEAGFLHKILCFSQSKGLLFAFFTKSQAHRKDYVNQLELHVYICTVYMCKVIVHLCNKNQLQYNNMYMYKLQCCVSRLQ